MLTNLKFKTLGNTKHKISSIGLGTGTGFEFKNIKQDRELIYLLQKTIDLGINFIDTAEVYFGGHAEQLIGKAFRKRRKEVFIATKFLPEHSSYKNVISSAEESLKRLQTDYIDLYQIHWPNPIIPVEETLKALEKLVKSGRVRHIGVSNFSRRQVKEIINISKIPIVSLQSEYNLAERSAEFDLIPFCETNKIIFIAYTPLGSGNILKTEKFIKVFSNLSQKYNKTVAQLMLNFLISHSPVIAIPATVSIKHLKENAMAFDFTLEKKDIQLLSRMFTTKVKEINTQKIKVLTSSDHLAYQTLEEAIENKLNLFPSPLMLSEDIQKGDFLKPVKLRRIKKSGSFEYELIGGRIRYWAWVIAFEGKKPIPAIVED